VHVLQHGPVKHIVPVVPCAAAGKQTSTASEGSSTVLVPANGPSTAPCKKPATDSLNQAICSNTAGLFQNQPTGQAVQPGT
jgi:hypothetical protein